MGKGLYNDRKETEHYSGAVIFNFKVYLPTMFVKSVEMEGKACSEDETLFEEIKNGNFENFRKSSLIA